MSCGNVLLFKAGGSPGDCEPCEDTWLCAQVTFGWVRSSSHLFQGQWPRAQASKKGGCHGLVFWLLVCCMMKWHRLRGHRASGADLPVPPSAGGHHSILTPVGSGPTFAITTATATMVSVDPEGLGGPSPSSVQPCHFLTLAPIKIPLRTTPFSGKYTAWSLRALGCFGVHSMETKAGTCHPPDSWFPACWGRRGRAHPQITQTDLSSLDQGHVSQPGHFLP